jgi:predicted nucleotidyltransferase
MPLSRSLQTGTRAVLPSNSSNQRLERVRAYLARLPLIHARGIVYGSVGRPTFGMARDIDLLVLSDDLPTTVRERIDLLGDHRTGLAEIDAIAWTEAKWQRRLSENEPFAALIQREGIAAERCGLTRE